MLISNGTEKVEVNLKISLAHSCMKLYISPPLHVGFPHSKVMGL